MPTPWLDTDGRILLTDGGLETCLIYDHGLHLQYFSAFPLVSSPEGRHSLVSYYKEYRELAMELGRGVMLSTPTWRASKDWGDKLGYTGEQLDHANTQAVNLVRDVGGGEVKVVIAGAVGPRGDGYQAGTMTVQEAMEYHRRQVSCLAKAGVHIIAGQTLGSWEEGAGLMLACTAAGIPASVGFTVETDGRLPSGQSLGAAVMEVDRHTNGGAEYYSIACAHPTHILNSLQEDQDQSWQSRVREIRVNASKLSHQELDNSTELDSGDVEELAKLTVQLVQDKLPSVALVGGCCGTSVRHVRRMGELLNLTNDL